MAKKKKSDRWLILLLIFAVLAALLYLSKGGGLAGGGLVPSGEPGGGDKCCCDSPFAFIVGVKGECKCMTCPNLDDSIIIMPDGSICCTSEDCGGDDAETPETTTTLGYTCNSIQDYKMCWQGTCQQGYDCMTSALGGCGCYPEAPV